MKTALVLGAGGFIGHHMVKRLKSEGYWVRGVDLKHPEFSETEADEFVIADLRGSQCMKAAVTLNDDYKYNWYAPPYNSGNNHFNEIYQFAADMGGAGYVFTGENDFNIMHNSAQINLNVLEHIHPLTKIFYSSSACIYPECLQDTYYFGVTSLRESDVYPANPDSDYGWEKLFSERLYLAHARNNGTNIRIARFHNIFGVEGTYKGGKEKAPAALCRKVYDCDGFEPLEVWGTGQQLRSFLYIDECIEAVRRLMESEYREPLNIGSDESISINDLAKMIIEVSGKNVVFKNVEGAVGVASRNSDNTKIKEVLNWAPDYPLLKGIEKTYKWIENELITR